MVITFEQKRKRQQLLVVVFFLVLAASGLILYFGFRTTFPVIEFMEEIIPPGAQPTEPKISVKNITLNLDIFESEKFKEMEKSLESYRKLGILPVKTEIGGRTNPFLPY